MSKNITIKQDGVAIDYNSISMLKTNQIEGGSTEWISEDECTSIVKRFNLNGEYTAMSRDGVKGYRAVFVNVPAKSVTGKDPETGITYKVTKDSNGHLVFEEVEE